MQITSDEAANALKDVELAASRGADARSYELGSLYLFLWGAIWVVGYGLSGVLPVEKWGWVWVPLSVLGTLVSAALGRARPSEGLKSWRHPVLSLVLFVFALSICVVMAPRRPEAYLAFPALFVAVCYSVVGAIRLNRYLVLGVALFALTLSGYFLLLPYLAFWLAAVGGGGLILGGLWFRKP